MNGSEESIGGEGRGEGQLPIVNHSAQSHSFQRHNFALKRKKAITLLLYIHHSLTAADHSFCMLKIIDQQTQKSDRSFECSPSFFDQQKAMIDPPPRLPPLFIHPRRPHGRRLPSPPPFSSSSLVLVSHLFLPLLFLLLHHPPLSSAYSPAPGSSFVYQCPMFSYMSPFALNYCGTGSIFHYYVCCDYNPTECCVRLETWAIIGLVLIGLLTLFGCLGCCAVCFFMQRR